jgi:hypothetical protein
LSQLLNPEIRESNAKLSFLWVYSTIKDQISFSIYSDFFHFLVNKHSRIGVVRKRESNVKISFYKLKERKPNRAEHYPLSSPPIATHHILVVWSFHHHGTTTKLLFSSSTKYTASFLRSISLTVSFIPFLFVFSKSWNFSAFCTCHGSFIVSRLWYFIPCMNMWVFHCLLWVWFWTLLWF